MTNLVFLLKLGGEGSEGVLGPQPVIWSVLECSLKGRLQKKINTTNLGFWLKLGGEGSEGVPGAQPVNGHYLNVPPKVPGHFFKRVK